MFKGDGFLIQTDLKWALKGFPDGMTVEAHEMRGLDWILHGPEVKYTREELDRLLHGYSVRQHVLLRMLPPDDAHIHRVKPIIIPTGRVGLKGGENHD
jgi:hypothetical protein